MPQSPVRPASEPPGSRAEPWLAFDPLTERAVFVAPLRAERPLQLADPSLATKSEGCPLCGGNESLTPPEVLRVPAAGGGWRARIVPNRYPIVQPIRPAAAGGDRGDAGIAPAAGPRPARGLHEVLIESPAHETRVERVPAGDWQAAWQAAACRLGQYARSDGVAWGMLFKNSGAAAGASLGHVHSQLVAIDFVPPVIRHKLERLGCDGGHAGLLDEARRDKRVWAEAGGLVAFVPPAPRQPFESWIMCGHPLPRLDAAGDDELAALAMLTRRYCQRLAVVAPGGDFNWWLHQPPLDAVSGGWHWHLEIMPRLTELAGFELGSGCHITTLPAREAAAMLAGA